MSGNDENVSNHNSVKDTVTSVQTNETIDDNTYQKMLDILSDLTGHSHTFFDDYGTACQCNCQCQCTCCVRGMVW